MRRLACCSLVSMLAAVVAANATAAQQPTTDGLTDVLIRVEASSPALKAAHAGVEAQRARSEAAKSHYFGEVEFLASTTHFDDPRLVLPISPPVDVNTLIFDDSQAAVGASFQIPIDVNGRVGANLATARYLEEASAFDESDLRLRLLNAAARLYRGLQRVVGQRDALTAQREALAAHLRVADIAVEVGRLAPVERLRVQAELKAIDGRLAALAGDDADLRARLAALLDADRYDTRVTVPMATPPARPAPFDTEPERPDLQAAASRTAASDARIRAARAERLPELGVAASWEYVTGYNESGGNLWSIGVQARWNLWDGRRRSHDALSASELASAAQWQQQSLRLQAIAEVSAAEAHWDAAAVRLEAARAGYAAATQTASIQGDRFSAGRLSAADLVDAEAALAAARSELSLAMVSWWSADDELRLALGGPPAAYPGAR